MKPVRTTYSYKQAICQQFKPHSAIDKSMQTEYCRMCDVSMMKIGLYLNNVTARNHDEYQG
jgi:hypothetical protein